MPAPAARNWGYGFSAKAFYKVVVFSCILKDACPLPLVLPGSRKGILKCYVFFVPATGPRKLSYGASANGFAGVTSFSLILGGVGPQLQELGLRGLREGTSKSLHFLWILGGASFRPQERVLQGSHQWIL